MKYRRLFKEACRLHTALVPPAAVHHSYDLEKLQELSLAVESLVRQVEEVIVADPHTTFPWTEDTRSYRLAYHALKRAQQLEDA